MVPETVLRGLFSHINKKQNPAFGGICCSQLVLVTQTLPKSIGVKNPQILLLGSSLWGGKHIKQIIQSLSKTGGSSVGYFWQILDHCTTALSISSIPKFSHPVT